MNFKIADKQTPLDFQELCTLLGNPYNSMIKFAIDIETEKIVFGGEMHADAEQMLLKKGSLQQNIWGANIYPERNPTNWLEYTSLINIRPSQDNLSMEILSKEIKEKIHSLVGNLIKNDVT